MHLISHQPTFHKAEETSISHTSLSMHSNSFNQSYWIDGELWYVLTGPVNQKLAESIYQPMSLNENWVAGLF